MVFQAHRRRSNAAWNTSSHVESLSPIRSMSGAQIGCSVSWTINESVTVHDLATYWYVLSLAVVSSYPHLLTITVSFQSLTLTPSSQRITCRPTSSQTMTIEKNEPCRGHNSEHWRRSVEPKLEYCLMSQQIGRKEAAFLHFVGECCVCAAFVSQNKS